MHGMYTYFLQTPKRRVWQREIAVKSRFVVTMALWPQQPMKPAPRFAVRQLDNEAASPVSPFAAPLRAMHSDPLGATPEHEALG
jgi:hypothetical protein